jgi:hypothetical protein
MPVNDFFSFPFYLGEIIALTILDSATTAANPLRKLLAAPAPLGNSIGTLPSSSANSAALPKLKKRKLARDTRTSKALKLAVGLLKEEFDLRTRNKSLRKISSRDISFTYSVFY